MSEHLPTEEVAIPDWNAIQRREIDLLQSLGDQIGYGRCIQILMNQWSEKLQRQEHFKKRTADTAAGLICVWCKTDRRTGKKVKK